MASGNDGSSANTLLALSSSDKGILTQTRTFTKKCGNEIKEDQANFSEKGFWGLWWDAKGFFNCSNVEEVTAHMEIYKKLYEEIDAFSALVEKNDPECYDELCDKSEELLEKLGKTERDASRDVENNGSTAICRMLREFLDENVKLLDRNLRKVACIVRNQKIKRVEQDRNKYRDVVEQMSRRMDDLIDENRAARRESEEKLSKLVEENEGMKEIVDMVRREKEEAERRSEAVRLESEERLKRVLEESEARSEARLQEMREEAERYRLEAERVRRESDEKLKQAVEEANRRSEARMQEMAEQNRANLQNITKMLERLNVP